MRSKPSRASDPGRTATWTLFEDRASTQVLGFALMFAVTMTTFALYQADVVPHQNREVEFDHNQEMASELSALRGALDTTTTRGVPASRSVELGEDYPARAVAVNPPNPTGALRTSAPEPLSLHGLVSSDARYWDGSTRSFDTRLLRYRGSYNHITGDRYGFEHGMTVKRYQQGGSRVLAEDPGVVEGTRINVPLLAGSYERHGKLETVEFRPVSSGTEWHRLTAQSVGGTDPYVELPTLLERDDWVAMVAGNPDISVSSYTSPAGGGAGTVRLELTPGETYQIRLTKAAVSGGTAAAPATAEYLSPGSKTTPSVGPDTPATLTVTARDRYGNPVAGEEVSFTTTDDDLDDAVGAVPATVTTDAEGRASVTVDPTEALDGTVTASIDGGGGYRELSFTLDTPSGPSGVSAMTIYTRGQMFENVGGASSLVLKEGRTVPVTDEDCLLVGDTGGGLLGSLLGALNCDSDSIRTIQGVVTLDQQGTHHTTVEYYLFDENGDGSLSGGDDVATIVFRDRDGEKIFEGELTDGAANRALKSQGVDLLDPGNYREAYWEDPAWYSLDDWGESDGYDSFDDVDLSKTHTAFVDAAAGRVTLDLDE